MKRYEVDNIRITEYSSVSEFLSDINSLPNNKYFKDRHSSQRVVSKTDDFYGTQDYQQAARMLANGWDAAAEKMTAKVKMTNASSTVVRSSKPSYGVVGSQASVPRYLQGIPTNMVSRTATYSKQKVVTITKGISYHSGWTSAQILDEGIKALQLIQSMENGGQRVRLNVMFAITDECGRYHAVCKVCVKQPDERLNISKMSFALAHTSMLRRFFLKWTEVDPTATSDMGWVYGVPARQDIKDKAMGENEYYIPERIVNLEQLAQQFSSGVKRPATSK